MSELGIYLVQECYGVVICVAIIACFMVINKEQEKKTIALFSVLSALVLVESVCGTIERYLGNQPDYSSLRAVLTAVCYITAPALLLSVTETLIPERYHRLKWAITIPQAVNILTVLSALFGPWCFSFDKALNKFEAGPLCFIPRFIPVVYLLLLIIAVIVNMRKKRTESTLLFIASGFVVFNFINELEELVPVNFREITIAITILAYFIYFTTTRHRDEVKEINVAFAETEQKYTREMVDQCIETLAYTIDAKDRYTKGHSSRVAKYARLIAQLLGRSEEECRQIYLAGLLHDIGKISITDDIINKVGKLSEDEYAQIRKHPERGAVILEKMKGIPYLQNGAKYHHERYDGNGYPVGLKGEEIPELARIIAVADAYDAMTSYRSYRPMMDQGEVKQELWKGISTQFDPVFARAMISLIDADVNYDMREKPGEDDVINFDEKRRKTVWPMARKEDHSAAEKLMKERGVNALGVYVVAEGKWGSPSKGFKVTDEPHRIWFRGTTRKEARFLWNTPTVVVFSSDDGTIMGPNYEELGVFMSAGYGWSTGSATFETTLLTKNDRFSGWDDWLVKNKEGIRHTITVREENGMIMLRITNDYLIVDSRLGIPENYAKDVYIAITGEYCDIVLD